MGGTSALAVAAKRAWVCSRSTLPAYWVSLISSCELVDIVVEWCGRGREAEAGEGARDAEPKTSPRSSDNALRTSENSSVLHSRAYAALPCTVNRCWTIWISAVEVQRPV